MGRRGPNLTDEHRAQIIAEKRSHFVTVERLAEDHGVTREHVHRLERNASEEVLKMAEGIGETLKDRIEQTMELARTRMHERLEDNEAPLNHITTAFGVLYDKRALELGKPTNITLHTIPPETHAMDFMKSLLAKMSIPDALALFRNSELAPLVSDSTRDRIALQLEAGEMPFPE